MEKFTFAEIAEGQTAQFEVTLTAADVDAFGALSGDDNPLHMHDKFARERGFDKRVVHGALLAGLVSRLVGVHLPGRNCLLQELRLKFRAPAYVGDRLLVRGAIEQKSDAVRSIVLSVDITVPADRRHVASGKAMVGFTKVGS